MKPIHKHISAVMFAAISNTLVLAEDSVLFQPIFAGREAQSTAAVSSVEQWNGWCAVKIIHGELATPQKSKPQSFYTTTDGQRLSGTFEVVNGKLNWRTTLNNSFVVDLETTKSIGPLFIGESKSGNTDTIHLVNNDRIDGFIESIDPSNGVSIQVSTPTTQMSQPPTKETSFVRLDRVAEIQLATKKRKPTGWRFWLADGSIIDADGWKPNGTACELINPHIACESGRVSTPWKNILSFSPHAENTKSLAGCHWTPTSISGDSERLSTPVATTRTLPSAFDAAPIDLYGPGLFEVSTDCADGILIASITVPPQLQGAVDCRATLESNGNILWKDFITKDTKPVFINIPMNSSGFKLRLDQSKKGALGCAIRLENAIIINEQCAPPSQPNALPTSAPTKSDM